ncbi:hypothetical protein MMC07_006061 [Pseudocyphellaria aurata]|nr:hypothetical protein [Pseudocyphellaria aurata]
MEAIHYLCRMNIFMFNHYSPSVFKSSAQSLLQSKIVYPAVSFNKNVVSAFGLVDVFIKANADEAPALENTPSSNVAADGGYEKAMCTRRVRRKQLTICTFSCLDTPIYHSYDVASSLVPRTLFLGPPEVAFEHWSHDAAAIMFQPHGSEPPTTRNIEIEQRMPKRRDWGLDGCA